MRLTIRSWCGLVFLALLLPACRTGGAKGGPASPAPPPDFLRSYEGSLRVLRARGDERAITARAGDRWAGECDVAVRVRSVAFEKAAARFALDAVGTPKVGARGVKCKRLEPTIQLALTGFPAGAAESAVSSRVDELLPTPEAYLRAKGTPFDRAAGEAPSEVASQQPDANEAERRLARAVVAWPKPLLSVDPTFRDPAKKVRYQGLIEIEAVVGSDGRLYRPKVKTTLEPTHESAVLGALPFWRFEPARRADGPLGARVPLQLGFRVY